MRQPVKAAPMSLFDGINLSIGTKFGAATLRGGKLGLDTGQNLTPPEPTPLTPATPRPADGVMGWAKANPATATGIVAGLVITLVLLLRR